MKNKPLIYISILAVSILCGGAAHAQPATSGSTKETQKFNVILPAKITVGGDISAIEAESFTCSPARSLKKGDVIAAMMSNDAMWSADTAGKWHNASVDVPVVLEKYPVVAMVKCSDGNFLPIISAILKTKADIRAGKELHSGAYLIMTERPLKAGESIAVFMVGDGMFSVEAAKGSAKDNAAKPWFAAFTDKMKPKDRAFAIEAWRIGKAQFGK